MNKPRMRHRTLLCKATEPPSNSVGGIYVPESQAKSVKILEVVMVEDSLKDDYSPGEKVVILDRPGSYNKVPLKDFQGDHFIVDDANVKMVL